MREVIIGLLLILLLAGIAALGLLPPAQGGTFSTEDYEGYYRDEARWVPIPLPDDMLMCRPTPDGKYTCIPVMPGSVLLVPVPEEAPVDTMRQRDWHPDGTRKF